jgi:hypothetical protein
MDYNKEVFDRQYPVVLFFVQHLAYYRGLGSRYGDITEHRQFWRSTCDAHLGLATVAWCKVFGSYKEDIHWTKTPTRKVAKEALKNFRERILRESRLTENEWKRYHQEMLDFRDKYVAHLDLHDPFSEAIPRFDTALEVAYDYQDWASDPIKPAVLNQPTLISQYEEWIAETRAVVSRETV